MKYNDAAFSTGSRFARIAIFLVSSGAEEIRGEPIFSTSVRGRAARSRGTMFPANDTQVSAEAAEGTRWLAGREGGPTDVRASNSSQRKQRQHGVSARSPIRCPARPPIHNGGIVPLTSHRSLAVRSLVDANRRGQVGRRVPPSPPAPDAARCSPASRRSRSRGKSLSLNFLPAPHAPSNDREIRRHAFPAVAARGEEVTYAKPARKSTGYARRNQFHSSDAVPRKGDDRELAGELR